MVLLLFARLVKDSLHVNTELSVAFVLSRAWIDEAESLKKIICLSVVLLSVRAIAADSNAYFSACDTEFSVPFFLWLICLCQG